MSGRRPGPVLVVDDHPLNCMLLERILELDGYETLAAASIAEAEEVLGVTVPPLIVLDIRLPDGDGVAFARRLRSDPMTSPCAILACSASASPEDQRRALSAGCDAYLDKPIEMRHFSELVASLMARGQQAIS